MTYEEFLRPKTKMLCVQADMEDVRYRAIVMPVRVEGVA